MRRNPIGATMRLRGQKIFLMRSELTSPAHVLQALVLVVVTIGAALAFFHAVDGQFTGSSVVSQVVVTVGAQLLMGQLILRRSALKARWGQRAFSIAFRWFVIPGLILLGAAIAHLAWIEGEPIVPPELAFLPSLYLLVSGFALWVRGILALGLDNLSMMYVLFPNEGRLIQSNIYSVLRHPIYSSVLRIAFALVLDNGSAFALLAGLLALLGLLAWLRWVEEPELIERFGEGYRAYRGRVPALFDFHPRGWLVLWRFLLTGE